MKEYYKKEKKGVGRMYCPKCNAEITGTESACPVCGVPFIQPTTPPVDQNGAKMINPELVSQTVQTVSVQKVEPKQPTPTNIKKEHKKIPPMVFIIIFLFAALGLLYFLAFSNFSISEKQYNTTNNNKKTSKTEDDGRRNYGGYKFEIPEGYGVKTTNTGLEFKGTNLYFTIGVDYSNDYKKYKEVYSAEYEIPIEQATKEWNSKKYLIFDITENNQNGTVYVKRGTYGTTFVGVIIRKDNKFATKEDYDVVFKLLSDATSNMIEFTPEPTDDIGSKGINLMHIKPVFNGK